MRLLPRAAVRHWRRSCVVSLRPSPCVCRARERHIAIDRWCHRGPSICLQVLARDAIAVAVAVTVIDLLRTSPLVWTYATQAEVFPINNFFVALLFLVLYLYARDNEDHCTFQRLSSPKLHYAIVGCFISGLSLTNQQYAPLATVRSIRVVCLALTRACLCSTSVFVIAPIAITLLLREGQHILGDRRVLATLSSAIAAGLSLYLLMPIQHLSVKENSWGTCVLVALAVVVVVVGTPAMLTHERRALLCECRRHDVDHGLFDTLSAIRVRNAEALQRQRAAQCVVARQDSLLLVVGRCRTFASCRLLDSRVGAVFTLAALRLQDTLWLGLALAMYGAWVCSRPVTSQLVERLCKFFKKTNAKNTTHERQAQAKHQQSMARCSWLLNQALGSSFLIYITLFFWLCNLPLDAKPLFRGVFERFFQQPNVIVFIWLGIGCSVLLTQVLVRFASTSLSFAQQCCFAHSTASCLVCVVTQTSNCCCR